MAGREVIAEGEVRVGVNTAAAEEGLRRLRANFDRNMQAIDRTSASAKLSADTTKLDKSIVEAKRKLLELGQMSPEAKAELGTKEFDAQVLAVKAKLKELGQQKAEIRVETRQLSDANRLMDISAKRQAAMAKQYADTEAASRRLDVQRGKENITLLQQHSELLKLEQVYSDLSKQRSKLEKEGMFTFGGWPGRTKEEARALEKVTSDLELTGAKIKQLGGDLDGLDSKDRFSSKLGSWISRMKQMRINIGPLSGKLSTFAAALVGLGPLLLSLSGGLGALVGVLGAGLVGAAAAAAGALGGLIPAAAGVILVSKDMVGHLKEAVKSSSDYKDAVLKYGKGSSEAAKKLEILKNVTKGISKPAQQAIKDFGGVRSEWDKLTKPSSRSFWDIAAGGMKSIQKLMPTFAKGTNDTFAQLKKSLDPIFKELQGKGATNTLGTLMGNFNKSLPALIDGLSSVAHAIVNIGEEGSRFLPSITKNFDDWAQHLQHETGTDAFKQKLDGMIHQAGDLLHLFHVAGIAIMLFFGQGASAGDTMTNSLSKTITRWNEWMRSIEGKKSLHNFFSQSATDTSHFFGALVPLIATFVKLLHALQPITSGILAFADALGKIVTLITQIAPMRPVLEGIGVAIGVAFVVGKIEAWSGAILNAARAVGILKTAEEGAAAAGAGMGASTAAGGAAGGVARGGIGGLIARGAAALGGSATGGALAGGALMAAPPAILAAGIYKLATRHGGFLGDGGSKVAADAIANGLAEKMGPAFDKAFRAHDVGKLQSLRDTLKGAIGLAVKEGANPAQMQPLLQMFRNVNDRIRSLYNPSDPFQVNKGVTKSFKSSLTTLQDYGQKIHTNFKTQLADLKRLARTDGTFGDVLAGRVSSSFHSLADSVQGALVNITSNVDNALKGLGSSDIPRFELRALNATMGNLSSGPGAAANFYNSLPKRKRRGGPIDLGNPEGDSVPAMLERGEYVLNRKAVRKIGQPVLDQINFNQAPRFQKGGLTDPHVIGPDPLRAGAQAGIDQVFHAAVKFLAAHRPAGGVGPASGPGGTSMYSGHPVAKWIIPELNWAAQHGWSGSVISGWRSYAEQAKLYAIYKAGGNIAAPPGQSEHESTRYPGGAVDLTDAPTMVGLSQRYRRPEHLIWYGSGDPAHFSGTGHQRGGPVFLSGGGAVTGKVSTFGPPGEGAGTTASGVSSSKPGIAIYDQSTLGDWFWVSIGGKTALLQQTDIGPAPWTGRKIDVTGAGAQKMGINPSSFPTDAVGSALDLGSTLAAAVKNLPGRRKGSTSTAPSKPKGPKPGSTSKGGGTFGPSDSAANIRNVPLPGLDKGVLPKEAEMAPSFVKKLLTMPGVTGTDKINAGQLWASLAAGTTTTKDDVAAATYLLGLYRGIKKKLQLEFRKVSSTLGRRGLTKGQRKRLLARRSAIVTRLIELEGDIQTQRGIITDAGASDTGTSFQDDFASFQSGRWDLLSGASNILNWRSPDGQLNPNTMPLSDMTGSSVSYIANPDTGGLTGTDDGAGVDTTGGSAPGTKPPGDKSKTSAPSTGIGGNFPAPSGSPAVAPAVNLGSCGSTHPNAVPMGLGSGHPKPNAPNGWHVFACGGQWWRAPNGSALGGYVTGGLPIGDSVPATLERGEYKLNKNAVSALGKRTLDYINFVAAPRYGVSSGAGAFMGAAAGPSVLNLDRSVTQHITINSPMVDPHTFSKSLAWEAKVA